MSICPHTQHHCRCQPDEGMDCPFGPNPEPLGSKTSTSEQEEDSEDGVIGIPPWKDRIGKDWHLAGTSQQLAARDAEIRDLRSTIIDLRNRLKNRSS